MRPWYFRLGLLSAVLVWTLAWYWDTAASMAGIWWQSETFAHGMIVYPISLWLVWRKRSALKALPCRPSWLAVALGAGAGLGWLLGDLAGVQAARHLGLVTLIACSVWAVLGTPIARAISFPLAFSLLAVPVGEFLLPTLIQHTADFTVGALRLSGIPVYREANNFVLPTGSWSVVEACSGLRYLIASVTLGLLYAYISYTSLSRRLLFVLGSIAVPIVANWVRAYMIVMIGHLSGMQYAVGVDHLLYGWLFFGVVMLLLFWIGSHWRQDAPERSTISVSQAKGPVALSPNMVAGALVTSAVIATAPWYAQALDASAPNASITLAAPDGLNGWVGVPAQTHAYRPHYRGARDTLDQAYAKSGRSVGLFIAYYARERQGSELIMGRNSVRPAGDRSWVVLSQGRVAGIETGTPPVQTRLRRNGAEWLVWHWYWAGNRWVVRPEIVKALQAFDRLSRNGDDAAVVVMYTPLAGDEKATHKLLAEFYADMLPSIGAALSRSRASTLVTAGAGGIDGR
ncbi:MAG: exosortase A [Burkholderiales bacterium]|nr:exosortase A [Burkholderiales bacterium]